jgi:hypothetical protein
VEFVDRAEADRDPALIRTKAKTIPSVLVQDYQRNGTVDLFAALDIARASVISDIRASHTQDDFVAFLDKINRAVPTSWTCT